jgi:glycosyltransferase 2 family protein
VRVDRGFLLRAAVGIAISVGAIWVLLRSVDVGAAIDVLRGANLATVGLMVLTVFLDVGFRGARWRALLAPIRVLPYRRVLGYTYVGYLANNILPARLGELVRSHALGEGEGMSRPTVLGTVVVERIVDTVIVVAVAGAAVLVLGVGGVVSTAVVLGAGFVGLLVVGLLVAVQSHRLPGAERVAALAERAPRLLHLGRRLRDGLAVVGRPRAIAAALGFSALAWIFSITSFIVGGAALGLQLSFAQGALLSSGVALATIVPSGPGYLGTFELTAVGIATQFGVGADSAFAMALLVHALILFVTSVGGAVAALRLGVGFGTGPRESGEPGSESVSDGSGGQAARSSGSSSTGRS